MPFVLDSSVALAWLLPDENGQAVDALADRLEQDYAVVPGIWTLEVGNALLMAQRRGRLRDDEIDRLAAALEGLPIEVDSPSTAPGLVAIFGLAKKLALTTYDAAYVELAQRRSLPLATLDGRLRQACTAMHLLALP